MEFYDNLKQNINEFFTSKDYNDLKNETTTDKVISIVFKIKFKEYPANIIDLIIEDNVLFLNIIDRFKNILSEYIQLSYTPDNILEILDILDIL